MEAQELQSVHRWMHRFPKLPLLIIEHVWAHNMMDVQQAVDPSSWPDMDSQPLSLEDTWRLRVASAQVHSIVKNRSMEHMDRALGFLDATHRLLPTLVPPIKHMKIMFGLKTMVVMWMLKEGCGVVETVLKINQFFPSKLPQYQDQCSQREMFLMRKNHLDFKGLAQTLAMDKDKLGDYVMNHMEEQYGERYAQKVEDRLLHYLHQLEAALPAETYIDKILKKDSPVTEAERLLLEVISSDSRTIATTLKKLLHCDVASCGLGRAPEPWKSEHGKNGIKNPQHSKTVLYRSSSKAVLKSVDGKTPQELEVVRGGLTADQDTSRVSVSDSDAKRHQQTEQGGGVVKRREGESSDSNHGEVRQRSSEGVQEAASSADPQFCSKHQRWVRTILQECPDEGPEEPPLQANAASSPLLFQSSSSTSSSQDLTPSDLIPCPSGQQHPPFQTSTPLQTAAQASEPASLNSKRSHGSASDTSQTEAPPQPSAHRDTRRPTLFNPVVRLIDIASIRGLDSTFKLHQAYPSHFSLSSNKQAAPSPQVLTSENNTITQESHFNQPQTQAPTNPPHTTHKVQTVPVCQDASSTSSSLPLTQQSLPRRCRALRRDCSTTTHSHALNTFNQSPEAEPFQTVPATSRTSCLHLPDDVNVSQPPTHDASTSTSTSPSGTLPSVHNQPLIPLSAKSSGQMVPQKSIKAHPQAHMSCFLSETLQCSVAVSTSDPPCLAGRAKASRGSRPRLRFSAPCQAALLQSKLLQPAVNLSRLSAAECYRLTSGRSSARPVQPVLQHNSEDGDEEENIDSSFDVNILYSSYSSNTDEDSLDCDPEYKPCIKKKRLLLEYEAARSLNHIE